MSQFTSISGRRFAGASHRHAVFLEIGKGICLVFSSAVIAAVVFWIHPAREDTKLLASVPKLSISEARRLGANIVWIDARPISEFEKGHIPGAHSLEESQFEEEIDTLLERWRKGTPLVVYCSSDSCSDSTKLALRLKGFGFSPVFVLKGDWQEWQKL